MEWRNIWDSRQEAIRDMISYFQVNSYVLFMPLVHYIQTLISYKLINIFWRPNAQCDGIRLWDDWKVINFRWGNNGGALFHVEISVSIRKVRENSLLSARHSKTEAICNPGIGSSPEPDRFWHPNFEISAFGTMKNKCLLFKLHSLHFVTASLANQEYVYRK